MGSGAGAAVAAGAGAVVGCRTGTGVAAGSGAAVGSITAGSEVAAGAAGAVVAAAGADVAAGRTVTAGVPGPEPQAERPNAPKTATRPTATGLNLLLIEPNGPPSTGKGPARILCRDHCRERVDFNDFEVGHQVPNSPVQEPVCEYHEVLGCIAAPSSPTMIRPSL